MGMIQEKGGPLMMEEKTDRGGSHLQVGGWPGLGWEEGQFVPINRSEGRSYVFPWGLGGVAGSM